MKPCSPSSWLGLLSSVIFEVLAAVAVGAINNTVPSAAAACEASSSTRDLAREKTLYVVPYTHMDTQWNWTFKDTIGEYIKKTLDGNFERLERHPEFCFNWTGSARYAMMKEYYPQRYERLKDYIRQGRWHVSGSSVDENDVDLPSAEALIRQFLYGNEFFRQEFGVESVDAMLPDCFGFPASLPSVLHHCGIRGFTTMKLGWGSAVGIPFEIGNWVGPDGASVICDFMPGGAINSHLDTDPDWVRRINANGLKNGVNAGYLILLGVGDRGGDVHEDAVQMVADSMSHPDGKIHVIMAPADQMYKDITPAQEKLLPSYKGDLLLTEHSTGSLSSQAYLKRWNRKNELLADAAERAAATAQWLGAADYPLARLNKAWELTLQGQMHDMLAGTAQPEANEYAWNNEILALNQFAAVLKNSVGAVAQSLDTRVKGQALVLYNPLAHERQDPVQAHLTFAGKAPRAVRIYDPLGNEVPSQVLGRAADSLDVLFLASAPPVSFSVYEARPARQGYSGETGLTVDSARRVLENARYRVTLDAAGDVASIVDKPQGNRELLAAPARLEFLHEFPTHADAHSSPWPAWNMNWQDRQNPPVGYVDGPPNFRVVEDGPVRVAIEVKRAARDSVFTQTIRLSAGTAGDRIEFQNHIDWQTQQCSLKQAFPLTVSNPEATYNWGLGTIMRGNNDPKKYEVPAHEWFDLTDASGDYGIAVLDDCKYGSDKPSTNTVRLTLLYTPGVEHCFMDQATQDWGRHDMLYALYGHPGDWRQGRAEWQGRRLNSPLDCFTAPEHPGTLGRQFAMLGLNTPQVDVRALKRAEREDQTLIVRLQELWGEAAPDVRVKLGAPITSAVETDGQERQTGPARVIDGQLVVDMTGYHPRTFAVRLTEPAVAAHKPRSQPVALDYNADVISTNAHPGDGDWAGGGALPAEMLPGRLEVDGIAFQTGPSSDGAKNAVVCRGQTLTLPEGDFNRVSLLAAADEDTTAVFKLGRQKQVCGIQAWIGFIGQWDDRLWNHEFGDGYVTGLVNGYIKRDPVAWFASHHHTPAGDAIYEYSHLFKYGFDLPSRTRVLTLPDNPKIKVLAVTVARDDNDALTPAAPLYDDFTNRPKPELRVWNAPGKLKGLEPVAKVIKEQSDNLKGFSFGPPSAQDYADAHVGHGVTARYVSAENLAKPDPGAGAVGADLPRLIDGLAAQNDNETTPSAWFGQGEGRFVLDLQRPISISKINTYSRHTGKRAPQVYSLWGSAAPETMPDAAATEPAKAGWVLLAFADTRNVWTDWGPHATSVVPKKGDRLGPYRYLMWVSESRPVNTFFTEVDVYMATEANTPAAGAR